MIFQRFIDAVDWLEEQGFVESLANDHFWRRSDGSIAIVHRDIDHTGLDDSRTDVTLQLDDRQQLKTR